MAERIEQPAETERPLWKRQLAAAGACAVLLVASLAAGFFSATLALGLMAGAFVAGLRYPLPEAVASLRAGKFDVDFLMLLVAAGAWMLGHPGEGAFLLVLFTLSRAMESYASDRTRTAIEALSDDFPSTATVMRDGAEAEVALEAIRPGERVLVRPGGLFPLDGIVVEGRSHVDVSAITGEEEPLEVAKGTEVPSGAINGTGLVVVEVLRPAEESACQKILRLVREAPARQSPQERWAGRAGRWFTAGILAATVAGFAKWHFIDDLAAREAFYRAMALLVAGSPCALVLSIPSAVLAGMAAGARRGVLFQGGGPLLSVATVRAIAFDKTGTLTTGTPTVARVEALSGHEPDDEKLALAATLARASSHPASRAVASHLAGATSIALQSVRETPGFGVEAEWNGTPVSLSRPADAHSDAPGVALFVGGAEALRFQLAEQLRPSVPQTVGELKTNGYRTLLLSGDSQAAASRVGERCGIGEAFGGLRPEEKHAFVERLSAESPVMMVGDGVNDAPALARADVGAAMGMRGSAAALAEAGVVLTRDRIEDLLTALELSRRARRIVLQNVAVAVGAAAILVAFALAGKLSLAMGVLGHEGGTVLVVLNSLRLLLPPRAGGRLRRTRAMRDPKSAATVTVARPA